MNHAAQGSEGRELWGAGAAESELDCRARPQTKKNNNKKTRNGHKESSCDAALPANTDRKPSVTLCPATHAASLLSAPSAVSERDGGKVPADPITRPTSQACESANAHRRGCRVGVGNSPCVLFFFRIRTR